MTQHGIVKHFGEISKLFESCHLSFTLLQGPVPSSMGRSFFAKFSDIISEMENRATISICLDRMTRRNDYMPCFQKKHAPLLGKTEACLVLVYIYALKEFRTFDEFSGLVITSTRNAIKNALWPHHNILVGKLLRNPHSKQKLAQLSAHSRDISWYQFRGIIIFLNYRTGEQSLICVPCFPHESLVFYPIRLENYNSLKELRRLTSYLNTDLRGGYVKGWFPNVHQREALCTVRAQYDIDDLAHFSGNSEPCLFHMLGHKYNFSFKAQVPYVLLLFLAQKTVIFPREFDNNKYLFQGKMEWTAFLAEYVPLNFVVYQERSHATAEVLWKPYSWEVWLLLFTSAVTLALLTDTRERFQKLKVKTVPIAWDIISTILDQSVSRSVQVVINQKVQNLLPPWLRLWMLMMIVLNNSYKGKIYTFIAHGIPIRWPSTLDDLLSDNEYRKISTSTFSFLENPELGEHPMIPEFLYTNKKSSTTNLANVLLFKKLNRTITYMDDSKFISYDKFVSERSKTEFDGLHIDNKRAEKFAVLNFQPVRTDLHFMTLHGKWVASSPTGTVPYIIKPEVWAAYKNFFTEHFTRTIGQVEQMGYRTIAQEYLFRFLLCTDFKVSMAAIIINHTRSYSRKERRKFRKVVLDNFRKCNIVVRFGVSFNSLETGAKPLSWSQLKGIFILFLGVVALTLSAFVGEKRGVVLVRCKLVWNQTIKGFSRCRLFCRGNHSLSRCRSKYVNFCKDVFSGLRKGLAVTRQGFLYFKNSKVRHLICKHFKIPKRTRTKCKLTICK